ncbi:hypothetical protein BDW72DRAFT_173794 [Aspergillus terricola var. indicus]
MYVVRTSVSVLAEPTEAARAPNFSLWFLLWTPSIHRLSNCGPSNLAIFLNIVLSWVKSFIV